MAAHPEWALLLYVATPAMDRQVMRTKPKLPPVFWVIPGLTCDFADAGGGCSWLRQGERDRGADEVEGFPLVSDEPERLHSEHVWQLCDAGARQVIDLADR